MLCRIVSVTESQRIVWSLTSGNLGFEEATAPTPPTCVTYSNGRVLMTWDTTLSGAPERWRPMPSSIEFSKPVAERGALVASAKFVAVPCAKAAGGCRGGSSTPVVAHFECETPLPANPDVWCYERLSLSKKRH